MPGNIRSRRTSAAGCSMRRGTTSEPFGTTSGVWPALRSRVRMLPPILPRPTSPSSIPVSLGRVSRQQAARHQQVAERGVGLAVGRPVVTAATPATAQSAPVNVHASGANNTAIGSYALQANTTASNNTAVGYQAGYSVTTGTDNVAIGKGAGSSNQTTNYNTAVGSRALEASSETSNSAS